MPTAAVPIAVGGEVAALLPLVLCHAPVTRGRAIVLCVGHAALACVRERREEGYKGLAEVVKGRVEGPRSQAQSSSSHPFGGGGGLHVGTSSRYVAMAREPSLAIAWAIEGHSENLAPHVLGLQLLGVRPCS